jgi:hypothetical protein
MAIVKTAVALPTIFLFAKAAHGYAKGRGDEDFILKLLGLSPQKNPKTYFTIHLLIFTFLAVMILAKDLGIIASRF